MVGCHRGVVSHSVFQRAEAEMEAAIQCSGVQMKGGTEKIIVKHCSFRLVGGRGVNAGGSTGKDFFRPLGCLFEAKDLIVEDCSFYGGQAAIAFVGVDGALVRHNTIYQPKRWAFRILQESQGPEFIKCRNATVEKNLIIFRSDQLNTAVNIGSGTQPETFTFQGNAWHYEDQPERTIRFVKLPTEEKNAEKPMKPEFLDVATGNLLQKESSPLRHVGVRKENKKPPTN